MYVCMCVCVYVYVGICMWVRDDIAPHNYVCFQCTLSQHSLCLHSLAHDRHFVRFNTRADAPFSLQVDVELGAAVEGRAQVQAELQTERTAKQEALRAAAVQEEAWDAAQREVEEERAARSQVCLVIAWSHICKKGLEYGTEEQQAGHPQAFRQNLKLLYLIQTQQDCFRIRLGGWIFGILGCCVGSGA